MRCSANTKLNKKCMNMVKNERYCYRHRNLSNCPICFEVVNSRKLDCGHEMHESCMSGLNKLECPLCRKTLKNIPKHIKKIITCNIKNLKPEDNLHILEIENEEITDFILIMFLSRIESGLH